MARGIPTAKPTMSPTFVSSSSLEVVVVVEETVTMAREEGRSAWLVLVLLRLIKVPVYRLYTTPCTFTVWFLAHAF